MTIQEVQQFLRRVRGRINEKHGVVLSQTELTLGSMTKLTEEVGELAEQINKRRGRQRSDKGNFAMEDLEQELADVILATIMMADELGVDMTQALSKKISIIQQRREQ